MTRIPPMEDGRAGRTVIGIVAEETDTEPAMPVIKGTKTETVDISGTGKTWTVAVKAKISGEEFGIFENWSSSDNVLRIRGAVTGVVTEEHPMATAVFTFGARMHMQIEKSGVLKGHNGASAYGDDARIENAGRIVGDGGLGIQINNFGGGGTIVNSGKVIADIGIYVLTTGASITNKKDGTITGRENGVEIDGTGDGNRLVNAGRITGVADDGFAVLGSDYDDRIVNSGRIIGAIDLGDGNDVFIFRKGKLSDVVAGGEGNDTLKTSKSNVVLSEQAGDGYDTVKSTVSYVLGDNVEALILQGKKAINGTGSADSNEITGNSGKNLLKGMAGDDWLDGGKGSDRLNGGAGFDTFVLAKGSGKDTVIRFEDGIDRIFVAGYADFKDPGDVAGHIRQKGDDTWVVMSRKDILVLKGIDADLIDSDDFAFVM